MVHESRGPGPDSTGLRNPRVEHLLDLLFADPEVPTWAVLDGARVKELVRELDTHRVEAECLFAGELHPSEQRVAPYLVRLHEESEFTRWLLEQGWGRSWGIFVRASGDLKSVRRHFRTLLRVKGPDGRVLYFRFYDPRVLRLYLPTCTAEEFALVFGPARSFVMEGEDGGALLDFSRAERPGVARRVDLR